MLGCAKAPLLSRWIAQNLQAPKPTDRTNAGTASSEATCNLDRFRKVSTHPTRSILKLRSTRSPRLTDIFSKSGVDGIPKEGMVRPHSALRTEAPRLAGETQSRDGSVCLCGLGIRRSATRSGSKGDAAYAS